MSSANLMIELEVCEAIQSWVNREYRRGLSMYPSGAPLLRISEVEVLFSTFTIRGWPVRNSRKSRVQTQSPKLNDEWGQQTGIGRD